MVCLIQMLACLHGGFGLFLGSNNNNNNNKPNSTFDDVTRKAAALTNHMRANAHSGVILCNVDVVFCCLPQDHHQLRYESFTGFYIMAKTFEHVKAAIQSLHKNTTSEEKVNFYNSWAENYDQDVVVLEYRAPSVAANTVSSHFSGDRDAAVVLDVACGTGEVARQMKSHGFGHFVGIDGSEAMLKVARESGLYQELKQCMMGEEPLPAQWDSFDVVVITGALCAGHVPFVVVRELCRSTKPGGYVCMTTENDDCNVDYKADLERELKQLEEEGLWNCIEATEVENWERALADQEDGYISGAVYLYKKRQQ
uniref:Williams-Beuren syndrome chromosomal region 27 protein-like isoform X2 n=1 Tax=Monopterus albus TaxID=43700 RepID=UPI0009B4DAB8|nr:Williams-Beuren syndrome chromosomal region 27 protein-like isoform X2 [Monopterus albus]